MSDPLINFFKAQLDNLLLTLRKPQPHASGPKKPTMTQQEVGKK